MPKRRILILICLVLVIFGYTLSLSVDIESGLGKFIYSNAFIPALLFFVFFGATAGVLKILVDALLPNRMPSDATEGWERTRAKGKISYVLNALLVFGLPLIVMLAVQFANSNDESGLRNFVVLTIVLIGGVAAITASLWNYQESMYLKAKERGPS